MNKIVFPLSLLLFLITSFFSTAHAQMMTNGRNTPSVNPTVMQNQQQDEATGKKLFEQLQNNQLVCNKLTNSDFEKIGEYTMSQMFNGNTTQHIAMNERIKQMMGDQGEERMHISIARSVMGCNTSNQQGGVKNMMGYGYNGGMMSGWGYGFGILCFIGYAIVLIDLILVGMWLWKQIKKN